MTIRTEQWKLDKIPILVKEGLTRKGISERLGIEYSVLSDYLRKMGLSKVPTLKELGGFRNAGNKN